MQNTTNLQERQARINAMKYEHVLQDLLDKDERIADLAADYAIAMMWFKATLHALHDVTRERDQARRTIREMRKSSLSFEERERPVHTFQPIRYARKHRATAARDMVQ